MDGENVIFLVINVLQVVVVTPDETLFKMKVQTFKHISVPVYSNARAIVRAMADANHLHTAHQEIIVT